MCLAARGNRFKKRAAAFSVVMRRFGLLRLLAKEGGPEALHGLLLDILDDEDEARTPVGIGPAVELDGRMQDLLHGMDEQRTARLLGEIDETLEPQQPRPVDRAQQRPEQIEGALRDGASAVRAKARIASS